MKFLKCEENVPKAGRLADDMVEEAEALVQSVANDHCVPLTVYRPIKDDGRNTHEVVKLNVFNKTPRNDPFGIGVRIFPRHFDDQFTGQGAVIAEVVSSILMHYIKLFLFKVIFFYLFKYILCWEYLISFAISVLHFLEVVTHPGYNFLLFVCFFFGLCFFY